jgi:hypothetical protein
MTRLLCLALLFVSSTALADHGVRPWHLRHSRPQPMDFARLRALTDACNSAMEGRPNEQRCLDLASRARSFDVEQRIRACEDAMEGDDNELTCIATMTSSRVALEAVRACEDAMEGDANELRCMQAVIGSRYAPGELVRYCEENETGDDAELACIARWR